MRRRGNRGRDGRRKAGFSSINGGSSSSSSSSSLSNGSDSTLLGPSSFGNSSSNNGSNNSNITSTVLPQHQTSNNHGSNHTSNNSNNGRGMSRKLTDGEQILANKNHRFAKELNELRVRLREEMRQVTRLHMENMTLQSSNRDLRSKCDQMRRELLAKRAQASSPLGFSSSGQKFYGSNGNGRNVHQQQNFSRMPPPPSQERHSSTADSTSSLRQPRRPISSSFDSIGSSSNSAASPIVNESSAGNATTSQADEGFIVSASSDLFANMDSFDSNSPSQNDESPYSVRPESPIAILDDDDKQWNIMSPPVSPGKTQTAPSNRVSKLSFTPELIDDEPLSTRHQTSFHTPQRNAFGEAIESGASSPIFNSKTFRPKVISPPENQDAFDASFQSFEFNESFGQDATADIDIGDFSNDDPFFSSYNNTEDSAFRSTATKPRSEKSSSEKPRSKSRKSPHKSYEKADNDNLFPDNSLEELDSIAMGSHNMKSSSMEADTGVSAYSGMTMGAAKSDQNGPTNGSSSKKASRSSLKEKYFASSHDSNKKESSSNVSKFPLNSKILPASPKSPTQHSPALVLRRLQQRRVHEKIAKASNDSLAKASTGGPRFPEKFSSKSDILNISPKSSLPRMKVSDSKDIGDNDLSDSHPTSPTVKSESFEDRRKMFELKKAEESSSKPPILPDFEVTSSNTTIKVSPNRIAGRSFTPAILKATHPSTVSPKSTPDHLISNDTDNTLKENDGIKSKSSDVGSSSIKDEIRRLDEMAKASQAKDPLRSSRRSVSKPLSYKEPSISSKLRQGDKFFPKEQESIGKSEDAVNNAPEILKDLAQTSAVTSSDSI